MGALLDPGRFGCAKFCWEQRKLGGCIVDSDQWLQDKSLHKTAAVEINTTTNVQYWLNENEQLVGVCVNFELADDVHYELNTENWFRFLREVLFIAPNSNCVVPFRDFLNTAAPQVDFGLVLDAKRIEYKKVAFHDCDIDDWDCVILTEELKPNSHDQWSWLFGELRRLFAMKAVFVKFHQACICAFALRSTAHIHCIFPLWLPASSRIVRNAALFYCSYKSILLSCRCQWAAFYGKRDNLRRPEKNFPRLLFISFIGLPQLGHFLLART